MTDTAHRRVDLEGVSKVFPGDVVAVRDLNLSVAENELLVLLGPSGCGKTTTLRLIAGLDQPTHGTIRLGGRVVNDLAPGQRDVAMVFQSDALYPHLTVQRNMAFGLRLREGVSRVKEWLWRMFRPGRAEGLAQRRAEIDRRVQDTACLLGIDELLGRYPRQLSGGQRQRVALGRAMVRRPAVFLFDEPLSNLDAQLRTETRRELKRLHKELEQTTIYVTHDQSEALTLGDRVAVMNEGEIQQIGTPLAVYHRPQNRFVAGFVGTPPMNFVEGDLIKADGPMFQADGWSLDLPEARFPKLTQQAKCQVVLGIRPEAIRPADTLGIPADACRLGVRVELVEPLGDAVVAHLEILPGKGGGARPWLSARWDARSRAAAGGQLDVTIEPDGLYLFDAGTGRNLGLPENG